VSDLYIVVSQKADLLGGNAPYSVYQWPGDAMSAAQDMTTNDRLPRSVYALELIAETEAPIAKVIDLRPQEAKS
jgi:hypothetical protein